jgi:hypothetical protein
MPNREKTNEPRGSSEEPSDREHRDMGRDHAEQRQKQSKAERDRTYGQTEKGKKRNNEANERYRSKPRVKEARSRNDTRQHEKMREMREGMRSYDDRMHEYEQAQGTAIQSTDRTYDYQLHRNNRNQHDWRGFVAEGQQQYGGEERVIYMDSTGQRNPRDVTYDQHLANVETANTTNLNATQQQQYHYMWDETHATPETSSSDSGTGF